MGGKSMREEAALKRGNNAPADKGKRRRENKPNAFISE
jgi:hypothetical protein